MTRTTTARALALKALEALDRRDAFADAVLDALLSRSPELAPRDRALVSHLVYGVLRWRNRLDANLAAASDRPLAKIHPRLLQVLRLGTYQVRFLDRIPDRAAVSESVELARQSGLGHATGFVNAVLRKVAASSEAPLVPEEPTARLSLLFGCPRWLVEVWQAENGLEGAEALCRSAARVPQVWLRVNRRRTSQAEVVEALQETGLEAGPAAYAPEGVWVGPAGDPRRLPPVAAGAAVLQDQAAQLVAHLVTPQPGWRVLDACAGPGLKATHLVELAGPGCRVTALDVHPHRARMVTATARQLGHPEVCVAVADARRFSPAVPFDAVLVDAPCSGLGVLDRNPEAKWRRKPMDLEDFPPLQLALLENLADCVRPGGILVYATCTTVRSENEAVVEAFLGRRPDFALEEPPPGPASWNGLLDGRGYLRTYPDGGEGPRSVNGFFGVRLRRRNPGGTP